MTFTKSPFGPLAKVTPTDVQQPNSPSQRAATGRFTLVAAFWQALTVAEKLAWSEAAQDARRESADAKKSYRLSGYALYSSLANVWLNVHSDAGTPPVNPPAGEYAGASIRISALASSGTVTFTGGDHTPAGTVVQFEIQPLRNAARKPSKGGYKIAGFAALSGTGGGTYQVSVNPGAYCARYAFVETATGRRTSFVEIPVSGVALALETGGSEEKAASAARKKAA